MEVSGLRTSGSGRGWPFIAGVGRTTEEECTGGSGGEEWDKERGGGSFSSVRVTEWVEMEARGENWLLERGSTWFNKLTSKEWKEKSETDHQRDWMWDQREEQESVVVHYDHWLFHSYPGRDSTHLQRLHMRENKENVLGRYSLVVSLA